MIKRTNIINKRDVELIGYLKAGLSRDEIGKKLSLPTNKACYVLSVLRLKTNSLTDRMLINKYDAKEIYEVSS